MNAQGLKKQDVPIEEISKCFNLPINDASRELGICVTLLKRICRRHGITRWPHRRLRYLDRRLVDYGSMGSLSKEEKDEVDRLKRARDEVLNGLQVEYCISDDEKRGSKRNAVDDGFDMMPRPAAAAAGALPQAPLFMMPYAPATQQWPAPAAAGYPMPASTPYADPSTAMRSPVFAMNFPTAVGMGARPPMHQAPTARFLPRMDGDVDTQYLIRRFVEFGQQRRITMP